MIQVNNLTMAYRSGKGVFDLDFTVKQGEVFGYLGPNGAGKTTTIRNLMGFSAPDSGSCKIGGYDCQKETKRIHQNLGYLPGEIAFPNGYTGIGYLKLIGELRGMKSTKRRDELIELFELDARGPVRRMSKGNKQKVGIVAAFMHDPDVYLLDEPTSGLDPLMQNRFVQLIQSEHARGKTILLSSHMFEEVERTCDRIAILRDGRLQAVEDIRRLRDSRRRSYIVTVGSELDRVHLLSSGLACKETSPLCFEIEVGADYRRFFETLVDCTVLSLDTGAQGLEQMFIGYYGEEAK